MQLDSIKKTNRENSHENTRSIRPNSLRIDFVWTMAGNVIYRACQWGMLMAIAKFTSPVDVGKFALGLAIVAPMIAFAELQLRGIQASDARDAHTFGQYLGLRLTCLSLVLVFSTAVAVLLYNESDVALIIILTAISKTIESTSDIVFGMFQKIKRMDKISISMTCKGITSLLLITLVLWLTHSIIWCMAVMSVSWLLVLIFYDLNQAKRLGSIKPQFGIKPLRSLLLLAAPLGIVMALVSLQGNIPRYFVEKFLGKASLGYFAALGYVVTAGATVIMALGQSAIPRFAEYFAAGNMKAFNKLIYKLQTIVIFLGLCMLLGAIFLGKWFLGVIYTAEYAAKNDIFIWLIIAGIATFIGSIFGCAATAARLIKVQVPQVLSIVLFTTVFCYLLVPRYGLHGAAWAMLSGMAVGAINWVFIISWGTKQRTGHI